MNSVVWTGRSNENDITGLDQDIACAVYNTDPG